MRVLVTNDDGVEAVGLHVLAQAVVADGHEVVIAAPDRDMSGSSAAIGQIHIDEHIDAEQVELPGLSGIPAYAVAGPPGLCVLAASLGGFGEGFDMVVSGINPGCNTGRAVLHSGTVGAALTGANFGLSGLAVSLDVSTWNLHEQVAADSVAAEIVADSDDVLAGGEPGRDDPARWDTAATVAIGMLHWLASAPDGSVLNINVPNLDISKIAGTRLATLAPFGTVRSSVIESADDGGRQQMELRPIEEDLPDGCDTALVAENYVAVTAITGPRPDDEIDLDGLLTASPVGGRRLG